MAQRRYKKRCFLHALIQFKANQPKKIILLCIKIILCKVDVRSVIGFS